MHNTNASSPRCKKNLKGMVFGNGALLALDAPPRLSDSGKWEWLCQCQIHDVPPKCFRITKLENGAIKGCGCHGGSRYHKNNDDLIGEQIGCVKVLDETRTNRNRPEFKVRCVVCKREKWVRTEHLRKHISISCRCIPTLKNRTIGGYYVPDPDNRRNDEGLPQILCATENRDEVWVPVEKLLRAFAKELRQKRKTKKHRV